MSNNYRIINLVNGLNIVGNVHFNKEDVVVSYPLEVATKPIADEAGNLVGENMVLRPYLVLTDDREVFIKEISVISTSRLSQNLWESYESMVETVYNKPVTFDGNFYKNSVADIDDLPEDIQDMDKEQLDYLEEQLDKIIDGKGKTYH